MAASSFASTPFNDLRAARKRMAAALALSLLVHLVFAGVIRGGSTTLSHRASVQQYIHARLNAPAPPTLPYAPPTARKANPARSSPLPEDTSVSASPIARETPTRRDSTALTAASAVDAKYYSARELDVYPAPLAPLVMNLTGKAAAARTYGYALLSIMLDATGAVTEVQLLEAEPAGFFDDDGIKSIASTVFTPALKNGRAVKTRIVVRIDYGAELDR
ncbi:MAG TPA: TonB family protein [Burkholderiales bacterium]|nr:TonB family protein [Burkholderiales bacterium]